ncbi:MAG: hypothetical protein K9N49_01080, partial [Candidatus Marinimicrobia bacterium]|nr:hypothetical protein [Candidatus Neomarinimicrobiota bacterium]
TDGRVVPPPQNRQASDELTPRRHEMGLATDQKRAFQHDAGGWVALEAELVLTVPEACQIAVGWKLGETMPGRRELPPEMMPATINRLSLRSIQVEKLDRTIALGRLTADKVVYKPGMQPVLSVPVINTAATPISYAYRVRMSKDIGAPVTVAEGQIEAAPAVTRHFDIELPALEAFGGYRFDFELLDTAGNLMASAERSAACSETYARIGIQGLHHGDYLTSSIHGTPEIAERVFTNAREAYLSSFELNFWPPCDVFDLTPEKDRFISSVMGHHWATGIKNIAAACRQNGIGLFTYAKGNYADGRAGLEYVQRHPELGTYERDTGRPMGRQDMERLVNWDDYERRIIVDREPGIGLQWSYIYLDATRPSVVEASAAEIIASQAMFGWIGVRFDGDFAVAHSDLYYGGPIRNLKGKPMGLGDDRDFMYAANLRRYKEKVRAAIPDFEFAFNHGFNGGLSTDIRFLPSEAEMARDGGTLVNEPLNTFAHQSLAPHNRWAGYADLVSHQSRTARALGGWHQPIGCYGMRADDYLYQNVYNLAAQSKTYGTQSAFYTPFMQRLSRFVTRYAGLLCADLAPITTPESRITVSNAADLEWQRYVSFMEAAPDRRVYLIQFVNPPVNERAKGENPYCLLRPPARDVRVELDMDSFERAVAAWQLDPWNEADQVAAPFTARADGVDVTLPEPVSIWSALVIECELTPTR